MHIEELSVNEFTVSKDDVSEQKGDYKKILNLLKVNGSSKKYTYSSSNNNVKYKTRS